MTSQHEPQTIHEFAASISEIDVDAELIRRDTLGEELSFEPYRADFDRAVALARMISQLPTDELQGTSDHSALLNDLQAVRTALQRVTAFSVDGQDPRRGRDQLITRLRQATDSLRARFLPLVGYLLFTSGALGDIRPRLEEAVAEWEKHASTALAEQQEQLGSTIEQAQSSIEAADRAASEVRSAAGLSGVAQYSQVFQNEAKHHRKQAMIWLVGALVAVAALLAAIVLMIDRFPAGERIDDPAVVQWLLFKALVVSFGSYIVFQCFRLFRSEQHLAVVNRHRDNALRTFETFAAASNDSSTRDAVLLEATRTIFAPGTTGLVDGGEASAAPAALLEIIRRTQGAPPSAS